MCAFEDENGFRHKVQGDTNIKNEYFATVKWGAGWGNGEGDSLSF